MTGQEYRTTDELSKFLVELGSLGPQQQMQVLPILGGVLTGYSAGAEYARAKALVQEVTR